MKEEQENGCMVIAIILLIAIALLCASAIVYIYKNI